MSERHDLVSRILKSSFIFAALFAASSVVYAIAESRLSKTLDQESALLALRVTLAIDKISLGDEIIKSEANCRSGKDQDCSSYIQNLVKAKNRINDYKVLLVNTLDYDTNSNEIQTLDDQRAAIDAITKHRFGLSLDEAKKKGLISIDQFLDYINANQHTQKSFNRKSSSMRLSMVFMDSIQFLNENVAEVETIKKDTHRSYQILRKVFLVLLAVEIMVFVLVNSADFLISNADSDAISLISLTKPQDKTKPLLASILLAFICLLIGQFLLYRESEWSLISNCREINRQNISLTGTLETYPEIREKSNILPLMNLGSGCLNRIEPLVRNDLTSLNKYSPNTEQLKLEVHKMKLRLYADAFQKTESKFDDFTSMLLLSILICNVSSLVALSLFLKKDSEEMG